jgi:hypothetical protein
MTKQSLVWISVGLLGVALGCSDDGGTTPGDDGGTMPGMDGGTMPGMDGGASTVDGGTTTDDGGTTTEDGGTSTDGGMTADDGGTMNDGGTGMPDGGSTSPCTCAPTEYCDYAMPLSCGGPFTCRARPEVCIALYDPVCGCDGNTYSNSCVAAAAGTDFGAEGECGSTTVDCRASGCPTGQYCAECHGVGGALWVCLPDDSAC